MSDTPWVSLESSLDCPGEYHINEKAKYNRNSWCGYCWHACCNSSAKIKIPNETQIIIIEKSDMDFVIDKKEIDIRVSAISSGSIDILKR